MRDTSGGEALRLADRAMIASAVGDALWNFVTWGNPETIGWVFRDVALLVLLGVLVWLVTGWRRNRR